MKPAATRLEWDQAVPAFERPFFAAVRPLLFELDTARWPDLEQLNALAASRGLLNAWGVPVRFVAPGAASASAMGYEIQIGESGEIPTRDNWHDLFNALQWLALPQAKAAINRGHVERLKLGGAAEATARSAPRDVLTMFDESGIIVASADESLLDLVRAFRWRELFVERRHAVVSEMRFVLAGHGLMEKSLAPFIGITAKAMLLPVAAGTSLDAAAAAWLGRDDNLADSRRLAPLPLLGIPGWDARNEDSRFYDNAAYFRPGRRGG